MIKKYVVNVYAEDGVYPKSFTKLENGVVYLEKQLGRKVDVSKLQSIILNNGYYSETDNYGRSIEIRHMEVGTCKVCKKKSTPLYSIRITPKNHKVTDPTIVGVCIDCADGYECGCWYVVQKGKRYVIVEE